MLKNLLSLYLSLFIGTQLLSQQTVGLFYNHSGTQPGYVLFSTIGSHNTYLIDKCGKEIHQWQSNYGPGQSVYLLPDGNLLRPGDMNNPIFTAGGSGGIIEKLDWNSNLIWTYLISDSTQCQHHDVCSLPNENVLAIVWESKPKQQIVGAGRNPATTATKFWSEKIIELEPIGYDSARIVWEWHVLDHLVQHHDSTKANWGIVTDHPELINLNYSGMSTNSDWLHINSVAYNPQLDQIILSVHNFNEVWIIDHSTTISEAASHAGGISQKGGDLLYRWGNPQSYDRGLAPDKKLFGQHNAQWIAPGLPDENKIMVYNNGNGRPAGNYSTVEIISPPVDSLGNYLVSDSQAFGPVASQLVYQATPANSFYSGGISGAQRLANGNTIICEGMKGNFFEVDATMNILWNYVNPVNASGIISQGSGAAGIITFRCVQYQNDYPGLAGKTLTPGNPIELNPLPDSCNMQILQVREYLIPGSNIAVFPNPCKEDKLNISIFDNIKEAPAADLFDEMGREIGTSLFANGTGTIDVSQFPAGIYFLKIQLGDSPLFRRMIILK